MIPSQIALWGLGLQLASTQAYIWKHGGDQGELGRGEKGGAAAEKEGLFWAAIWLCNLEKVLFSGEMAERRESLYCSYKAIKT